MKVYEVLNKTKDIQDLVDDIRNGKTVDMDDVEVYLIEYRTSLLDLNIKENI